MTPEQADRWIDRRRAARVAACLRLLRSTVMARRVVTPELHREMRRLRDEGTTQQAIAKALGLPQCTVSRWIERPEPPPIAPPRKAAPDYAAIYRARREREARRETPRVPRGDVRAQHRAVRAARDERRTAEAAKRAQLARELHATLSAPLAG